MKTLMYLRKSRADVEAEARGEGETLSKHKKALLRVAGKQGLSIVEILQEVESGESIVTRPEMLRLLKEVESGEYDAVLCMDVDRLGRGKAGEQETILETFKFSNTKIITPRKVYDLTDEWDEEYSEFEAFMARKEYKMINRRLQRGRVASLLEGNYLSPRPPYGYDIKKEDNRRYLAPNSQSDIVMLIFTEYISGKGSNEIVKMLNSLGVPSYTGIKWEPSAVRCLLKNKVYIGTLQWGKHKEGTVEKEGCHEPIVDTDTFRRANEILTGRTHPPTKTHLVNPLAGLIRCKLCGASMVLKKYSRATPQILCPKVGCKNVASAFERVESRLLESLYQWLEGYHITIEPTSRHEVSTTLEKAIKKLSGELASLKPQRLKLFDLLERGIYDEGTFLERSKNLSERISQCENSITELGLKLEDEKKWQEKKQNIVPQVRHILDFYDTASIERKNYLLKEVVDFCVYSRESRSHNASFLLEAYIKD